MLLNHTEFSGVSNFFSLDSKDQFEKNLKELPEFWIWRNTPVTYTCNDQGYRCPNWQDINWSQSIIVLGCSFTFGVGIDDKMTFSYRLQERLGIPVINLGAPGTSPMFQWVNTTLLIKEKVKPLAVIYNWPPPNRITKFLGSNRSQNFGPSTTEFCKDWILDDVQSTEYLKYVISSTRAMWPCPTLHYTTDNNVARDIPELTKLIVSDHARDFYDGVAHPGPVSNQHWANVIFNDIRIHL